MKKPTDYIYKVINNKGKIVKTGLTYNEASDMMKVAREYGIKLTSLAEV